MYVCVFTHHTFCFTPCLMPSFFCTASSHIQSSHRGASKDGPLLLLCLPLFLQQLLLSLSLGPCEERASCFSGPQNTSSSSAPQPPRRSAHKLGISFGRFPSLDLLSPSLLFLSRERGLVSTALLSPTPAASSHPFISSQVNTQA